MRFVSIPARNLSRRPMRSVLTALGVAFAVAGFVVLTGFSRGMEHAWTTSLLERDVHLTAVPRGTVQILAASIDERLAARVAAVDGVRDASGELADMVMLPSGRPVLVVGWPARSFLWRTLRLSRGRLPAPAQTDAAVLGEGLAGALRLEPGGTLALLGAPFTVSAVFRPSGVINNNMLILPLATLQRLLNRAGQVTVLDVRLARPGDVPEIRAVQARLAAAFPDLEFTETRFVADSNDVLRLIRAMAWGISLIALTIGLLTVLNTLLMSVTERTREFGVLSAVGWSPSRVLAMVVLEGLALSLAGSAAGIALGIGGLRWLAASPMLRGLVEPQVGPGLFLQVCAVTLLLGVIGSLYPAGRAVRVEPVEALRYE
ncbi:MAG TPA: FtsX-like permease family protein [bacterium]|nr:FtsX-like permease family protein [bacterium]